LIATVIDKFVSEDGNYGTLVIDDGSDAIRVKVFRDAVSLITNVEKGDMVLVIGKVREYGGELYINAEVIKNITDPNAECLRALEVLEDLVERKRRVEELKALSEQVDRSELLKAAQSFGLDEESLDFVLGAQRKEYAPQILKLIESLDKGEGVEIAQLFKLCELPEHAVESALNELLARGEVYEPTPGRLRKVSQ